MEDHSLIARYQIEPYRGSLKKLQQIAVAFMGSPQRQREPDKVVLLNDPLSQQATFYEFRSQDILYVEESPGISMPDGSMVSMVRVWVRKGTTALRVVPFHVQDTTASFRDFFER